MIGPESAKHHKEIEEFTKISKADGLNFHAMSYQDLIIKFTKNYVYINKKMICLTGK